jgi:hypothetical protein
VSYNNGQISKVLDDVETGIAYWIYYTSDTLAAVQASGYISDATNKRIKLGDVVDVFSGTLTNFAGTSGGTTLGGVTFPPTVGVTSRFTAAPVWARMQVSAVTAATTTTAGAATLAAIDLPIAAVSTNPRNLIDGGDFTTNPWQLGTSFNGTGATAVITADRWCAIAGASLVWNSSQQSNTNVAGFSAAYQWGRSVGDTHTTGLTLGQVLETADTIRLQGLPVTLSYWAGAGGNFAVGASGGTYLAQIIAGTGTNETFLKMISAGSWSGYSVIGSAAYTPGVSAYARINPLTAVVPTNATELGVAFSYQPTTAATSPGITAGANEWLQFLGIQLEVGGMTPFEHLDVAEVVNICTRYLQVINEPTAGIAIGPASYSASSIAQVHIPLPSPMRKAPTLTFTAGGFDITDSALGAHTISGASLAGATTGAVTLTVTCATALTAGLVSFMQGRSTNSGIIILDADYA